MPRAPSMETEELSIEDEGGQKAQTQGDQLIRGREE